MMYKHIYIAFIFFVLTAKLSSQKEFHNWYFGMNRGITFNTPDRGPAPIHGGATYTREGSFTMSDSSGNLLFYIGSDTIYNKHHKPMPDNFGSKMGAGPSSTQGSVAIKKPGSDNIYYIVTVGEWETPQRKARLWTLDMNLDNGLGSLVGKDVVLLDTQLERLAVCRHANKKDVWLIISYRSPGGEHNYRVYPVTSEGVDIGKAVNTPSTLQGFQAAGQMKISPDGKYLAAACSNGDFEIARFDNSTGEIFQAIRPVFEKTMKGSYGLEFSPGGNKLYVSADEDEAFVMTQFDISVYDKAAIESSGRSVKPRGYQRFYGMQLAPNRKIYTVPCSICNTIVSIENPDAPAVDLVFEEHPVSSQTVSSMCFPTPPVFDLLDAGCERDGSVSMPDTVVLTGSPLCIPVVVGLACNGGGERLPESDSISLRISYNPKVFRVDKDYHTVMSEYAEGPLLKETEVLFKSMDPSGDTLYICGNTYLADTLSSPLKITFMRTKNKGMISYEDGSVTLYHCMDSLAQILIDPLKPVVTEIKQELGSLVVGIETAERGSTEMLICDVMGSTVYRSSFFKSEGNYSRHEMSPEKELARGIYFMVIRSGRQSLGRTFVME